MAFYVIDKTAMRPMGMTGLGPYTMLQHTCQLFVRGKHTTIVVLESSSRMRMRWMQAVLGRDRRNKSILVNI